MIRVTAAVIEKDRRVLVARRAAGQKMEGFWEFPGGKLEPDETPEQCIIRELGEEFCIVTRVVHYIGSGVYQYPDKAVELIAFRMAWESGDFILSCHDEIRWLYPDELHDVEMAPADAFIVEYLLTEPGRP